MPLSKLLLPLVALALLATDAAAQSINSVSPSEGSFGSVLTIGFSGDLGKGKPKVWFTETGDESKKPKKYALKVLDVSGAPSSPTITAEVRKGLVGTFDLNVRPKVKGASEVVSMGAFVFNAPSVQSGPTPDTATPGEEVTMTLVDVGNKKPKVKVGGKKTKVTTFTGDQGQVQTIAFKIPKSLANGIWPIEVSNKAGSTSEASVEVTGSTKKLGKSFLNASINGGKAIVYKGKKLSITNVGNSLQILATSLTNPSKNVTIIVPFVEVGTFTQFTLPIGASISYAEVGGSPSGGFSSKIWQTNTPPIEVVITSVSGGQFAGTFSGTLVSTGGDPDITIEGEFIGDAIDV